MPPAAGDVILCWDHLTTPQKHKIHICIAGDRQLFLRINSAPRFPPHHLLTAADNPFLHHDSYVELRGLTRLRAYELMDARPLGRLSAGAAAALIAAAEAAATLSQEHKDLIRERLSEVVERGR